MRHLNQVTQMEKFYRPERTTLTLRMISTIRHLGYGYQDMMRLDSQTSSPMPI